MNIAYKMLAIILVLSSNIFLRGEIGCMDNSERLKKTGDTKEYHYVSCNCPCQRYAQIADRNKCTKCGHYHDIRPYIIISRANQAIVSNEKQ